MLLAKAYGDYLKLIAKKVIGDRGGRIEPRALKIGLICKIFEVA